MPITLLTGLAGTGKSSRLVETVNAALEQGRPVLTFACSESPWLKDREDIQVYKVLTCRRPGLVCPLHHFVSAEESAEILGRAAPGTLVAFEEAQYFGPTVVPHWLEADRRGVDILVASPSGGQIRRLNGHECARVHLVIKCQRCGEADAVNYFLLPDRKATLSVCDSCRALIVQAGHQEILDRLRKLPPFEGEEVIDQPVELAGCAGWRVLRTDCATLAGLMSFMIRRSGVAGEGGGKLMNYLDVGCGTGYFCHHLRHLRFFSEGVDASEGNVAVARLLDSYLRRDHNAYATADPYDYLRDTQDRSFDVTSAFGVASWFDCPESVRGGGDGRGDDSLRRLFAKTKHLCFVTTGLLPGGPGADAASMRQKVLRLMVRDGGFADVRVLDGPGHGLMGDLFVGAKAANGNPADRPTVEPRAVTGRATINELLEEVEVLADRVSRKGKIVDALMTRVGGGLRPEDLAAGTDAGRSADVFKELKDLQDRVEAEKRAAEYRSLVYRVRLAAQAALPPGATVLVVSKGDEELLKLEGRSGWHFPQNEAGIYTGSHPADSAEVVTHVEALRSKGAEYLLLPSTAFWWLEHYGGLREYLARGGGLVSSDDDCAIYALRAEPVPAGRGGGLTIPSQATFKCNICGAANAVAAAKLERETRSCSGCGSSVRLRAVIHVLSLELFGKSLPLLEFPERKDIVGAGMTDPDGYARGLVRKFSYTNTFYHQEPRLDITQADPRRERSLDFLISSEVFEHVPPPLATALRNLRGLMKPGGVVIFTVPYAAGDQTVEHFPDLHDYEIVAEGGRHVLRNCTKDGRRQVFENLVFHGGPGETLEMRVFGEGALLRELEAAGFDEVTIHRDPNPEFGIYWKSEVGLPIAARVR